MSKLSNGGTPIRVVAAAVSLLVTCTFVFATTLVEPPTRKSMARVWLSRANDGIESARLDLNENGAGTLIINFSPAYPTRAFRVAAVDLSGSHVRFRLTPIDPDPDGLQVSGSATPYELNLDIRGTAGTAKAVVSHLRFEPYDRVLQAIQAVDARAAALNATGRGK